MQSPQYRRLSGHVTGPPTAQNGVWLGLPPALSILLPDQWCLNFITFNVWSRTHRQHSQVPTDLSGHTGCLPVMKKHMFSVNVLTGNTWRPYHTLLSLKTLAKGNTWKRTNMMNSAGYRFHWLSLKYVNFVSSQKSRGRDVRSCMWSKTSSSTQSDLSLPLVATRTQSILVSCANRGRERKKKKKRRESEIIMTQIQNHTYGNNTPLKTHGYIKTPRPVPCCPLSSFELNDCDTKRS